MALFSSSLCISLWVLFTLLRCGEARIESLLPDQMADDEGYKDPLYKRQGQGVAKDEDSNGKFVGDYNSDCSESLFITPTAEARISPSDDALSEPNTKCHWDIIGTDKCIPILECAKFKLAEGKGKGMDKCSDEYLEVTDGVNGYIKLCGSDGPNKLTTTNGLRDMYISYKSNGDSDRRKLKCTVTCSLKKDGTPLPSVFKAPLSDMCHCGRKPNADRIVGGEDAHRGEFPWIAGMVTAKTRRPFCGGTLINNKFIVTAAHCFKGPYMQKENIHIMLNGHFMDLTSAKVASGQGVSLAPVDFKQVLAQDSKEGVLRGYVEKYFIHPLYVRQTNDYDVALIKLKDPVDFQKYTAVSPACLDKPNSHDTTYEQANAWVAGWGLNASDATFTMGTLQKLVVKIFTPKECHGFFDERFSRRMMCAGYKAAGKDSCKGDSGGPLIAELKKQVWSVIGTVSWGQGCAEENAPGVYLRLAEVIQWIYYTTNNEDSVWCSQ